MHSQLLLQALVLTLAAASPLPQRTDLSGLTGSGGLGAGDLTGSPLSGGGSRFNLTRITSLFSGLGSGSGGSGSGSSFDLSKLLALFGGGSGAGAGAGAGLPADFDLGSLLGGGLGGGSGGLPSFPSIPSTGGGSGGLPSIPSIPSTGGGSGGIPSIPSTGGSTGGGLGGGFSLGGNTANDVTSKKACKPNILLFARGTTEGGNMGSSVGPSLQKEIEKLAPGKFLFQGVDYAADINGIVSGGSTGGQVVKTQLSQAVALCPEARIFLGGYSQGAMVVRNGFKGSDAGTKAKVGGIVTFGDPFQRQTVAGIDASKVKVFCNEGDGVCGGTFAITAAHLQYTSNGSTAQGAQFIAGFAA